MREILFRGKRIDNGEWIEGYLRRTALFDAEGAPQHWHMAFVIEPPFEEPFSCEWAEVNPETVGQFTGLCDKNGKKIFEGDIVKGLFLHGLEVLSVVGFEGGAFGLKWNRGDVAEFAAFTSICNVSFEGIGNIHDNPELLGGNEYD